jgi:4-amino-4-deoxychorismate lyase
VIGADKVAEIVRVNGVEDATISYLDRGLHFGDGLFETIACRQGAPRFLPLHLERLALGCARLRFPAPDLQALGAEIQMLAQGVDRAIIKAILTRGVAVARGYGISGTEKATHITIRYPWPSEDPSAMHQGVQVGTLTLRLSESPLLAGLKHCNRLEQILARAECSERSLVEGILFSTSGKLVSGTMSNLFLVHGSAIRTPLLDRCGVTGVMRRVVMREAARAGIPVQECDLSEADLRNADELFLTNARIGIWPVRSLDERPMTPGPMTRHLQEVMTPLLEDSRVERA